MPKYPTALARHTSTAVDLPPDLLRYNNPIASAQLLNDPRLRAAGASILGNFIGQVLAEALTVAILPRPPVEKSIVITDATAAEAEATLGREHRATLEEQRAWSLKRRAIAGALSTMGSAVVTLIAVGDQGNAGRAAVGAGVGTGTVALIDVATNTSSPLVALLAGALGAAAGAGPVEPA